MEQILWVVGCTNMAAAWALSAVGHHSKKFDATAKVTMNRAVHMH